MLRHRKLFWILSLPLGFLLQVILGDKIALSGIFPNFLLLGTIFFAIYGGPIRGESVGFFWGILADAVGGSLFGSQTFMLTLIGYIIGRLQGKIDEEKTVAQIVLVLGMSFFHILGMIFFGYLFLGTVKPYLVAASFLQPLYTTLVSPLFFWLLLRWCALFRDPLLRLES